MSVVVPVFDVAAYLPAALDSVLAQEGVALEVIVVDDGSRDGSGDIAERYAARDARVRVVHQDNAGLGAARNTGIRAATGEYLTFVDADDVLPPGALAVQVSSLEASGSDLALGRVHRLAPDGSLTEPVWVTESHRGAPLRAVTVEQHPLLVKDVVACNRVHRRSSWDARVGLFPQGVAYEDHVPTLATYLGGARVDVLDEVTYHWRTRQSSISQSKAETENLADRLAVMAHAWQLVQDEAPAVRDMWLARALELDLAGFYRHAVQGDAQFRAMLREAATHYLDLAGPRALRHVSVHRKVSAWLTRDGRWEALAWLEQDGGVLALRREAHLHAGWPVAESAPLAEHLNGAVPPPQVLALSAFDTSVRARVTHVAPTTTEHGPALELSGEVWLRGAKGPAEIGTVHLELRPHGDPAHPPLRVPARTEGPALHAVVDLGQLRAWMTRPRGRVTVEAHVSWGEVDGRGPVAATRKALGAAPEPIAGVRPVAEGGRLVLRLRRAPHPTTGLRVGRRHAEARLADGTRLRLPLPRRAGAPLPTSGRRPLGWPETAPVGVVLPRGLLARRTPWRWEVDVHGEAVLVPRGPLLELLEAAPDRDGLVLTLAVRDSARLGELTWSHGTATGGTGAQGGLVTLYLGRAELAALARPARLTAHSSTGADVTVRWARGATPPWRRELGEGLAVQLRRAKDGRGVTIVVRSSARA